MRPVKSVSQMSRKMSKVERAAREEAEKKILKTDSAHEPFVFFKLNEDELYIFNRIKTFNELFTEADSISLSMLSIYLNRLYKLQELHSTLDIEDERSVKLEKRIHAHDKIIMMHMTSLCIPLNQRLRLANDVAKLKVEEKKLEQMNLYEEQEENPLLALLRDVDRINKS